MPRLLIVALPWALLGGCDAVNDVFVCSVEAAFRAGTSSAPPPADAVTVVAHAETEPVADPCDAADDPALWVNPAAPEESLIVATNKRRGLVVYDLGGGQVSQLDAGQTNNVDLRSLPHSGQGEEAVALVAASNRSSDTVDILHLFADGRLVPQRAIPAGFDREPPYGLCLYRGEAGLYAFVTYKDGAIRQWRLGGLGGDGAEDRLVRTVRLASQLEGCVADDPANTLFVGEEDTGIWRLEAEPESAAEPILIDGMRDSGGHLSPDVEGLAIHASSGSSESGFLVASSQGNSSFVLYDRSPPHVYRGSFRIGAGDVDEVTDTDGIAIASTSLGSQFRTGLLVAQDGDNRAPSGDSEHQNFKLVRWQDVTSTVGLP